MLLDKIEFSKYFSSDFTFDYDRNCQVFSSVCFCGGEVLEFKCLSSTKKFKES